MAEQDIGPVLPPRDLVEEDLAERCHDGHRFQGAALERRTIKGAPEDHDNRHKISIRNCLAIWSETSF